MTRMMVILAVGWLLSMGPSLALAEEGHEDHGASGEKPAQQMGHGSMGQDKGMGMGKSGMEMGKSGMAMGEDMHDMHAHMQALHDHSKMMEGMTDQGQLVEEMKKHLRMMDEMMDTMMKRHMQSREGSPPPPQ